MVLILDTNIMAKDTLSCKNDIIFFGGLLLNTNGNIESFGNKHFLECDAGIEYFIFKKISTGIELDYIVYNTDVSRHVFNGDYYTLAHLSLYTKASFYLKPSVTLHFKPQDKTYPFEFRYSIGMGKRFYLSEHIAWKLETNLTRYREQIINSDGEALDNNVMMISFNTGLQIFIKLKTKSE